MFPGTSAPSGAKSQCSLLELQAVVIDFETTGLYPNQGDEIVELGAVRVRGLEVCETEYFERLVNPLRLVSRDAQRVHGISDAELATQPPIQALLPDFMGFVGDHVVVGQNIAFDLSFLARALDRCVLPPLANVVLDTRALSRLVSPGTRHHSLDAIAARLGVEKPAGRHRALADVVITARCLVVMLQKLVDQGIDTLGALATRLEGLERGRFDDPGLLRLLRQGLGQRKALQIAYTPSSPERGKGDEEVRRVDVFHLDPPYFMGYCHSRKSIRTFRVDRVSRAELLEAGYEIPENFDPRDHFRRW